MVHAPMDGGKGGGASAYSGGTLPIDYVSDGVEYGHTLSTLVPKDVDHVEGIGIGNGPLTPTGSERTRTTSSRADSILEKLFQESPGNTIRLLGGIGRLEDALKCLAKFEEGGGGGGKRGGGGSGKLETSVYNAACEFALQDCTVFSRCV